MIKPHCFTDEWLAHFKAQRAYRRIDKIILEKMIYALHLLEQLKINGLDFVFKGGTSLVLLLEKNNRFSIDIDIICKTERIEVEDILNKVVKGSRFTKWELDAHRSYKPGIPKAHYKFFFKSNWRGSGTILLDILIEDAVYPEMIEKTIANKWIETDAPITVLVPTIDAIAGDKLTAFAPETIGIPYYKGLSNQSYSMEICKQLFDLSQLFEHIEDVKLVAESFKAFAVKEITYREQYNKGLVLTPESALIDTINTCKIIAMRGKGSAEEQKKFAELQKGISAFGTGFLMSGNFRLDDALSASAKVALLASKIFKSDFTPIDKYDTHDLKDWSIAHPDWNFLNRLKRQPDRSAFFYWYQTVRLLTKDGSGL
ncbi:MAG: nucleotidyl transferase AbiEii/AbiGii toxin family protein [bacterium]|nr:nucleotidyl transferase AbiEii/AbiGii toxin family protein [bacterium]